jgi:hypothetical protein
MSFELHLYKIKCGNSSEKIHQLITDKIGCTYVATFQFRSEVGILNCTEKKLLKKQRMNKTPRCRILKKLFMEKTFSPNVVILSEWLNNGLKVR